MALRREGETHIIFTFIFIYLYLFIHRLNGLTRKTIHRLVINILRSIKEFIIHGENRRQDESGIRGTVVYPIGWHRVINGVCPNRQINRHRNGDYRTKVIKLIDLSSQQRV